LRAGKALHFSWRDGEGEGERERERRWQNIGIKSIQEDRKEEVLKEREGMGINVEADLLPMVAAFSHKRPLRLNLLPQP